MHYDLFYWMKMKDLDGEVKDSADVHVTKDGQLILDFLQAIHAAEKRQAALDAQKFGEEKRIMKVLITQ